MILDVYTCLWNEAKLLPFFLEQYDPHCRRIIAMDDGSDDGTLALLSAHPKVEVRRFPRERDSWVLASTRWWDEAWKESIDADWVAIVTVDEIVGPDLSGALTRYHAAGATVLKPRGFDMVSEQAVDFSAVRNGVFNPLYSKPCLFRPDKITGLSLQPGNHDATFDGDVHLIEPDDLALHHYRYVGREETWTRYRELDFKRRAGDKARRFGSQYALSREKFDATFDDALARAEPVIL